MGWQKIRIVKGDGVKLSGLLQEGTSAGPAAANRRCDEKRPLVIVCHGFTGSKNSDGRAAAMGDELARLGFATLLFDFTGCGESEGLWEEITLSRQIEDLATVVEWARSQGYRQIILNGRSFGGTTVLAYAAQDRKITAVCTWAAAAHPLPLFSGLIGVEKALRGSADEKIYLPNGGNTLYLYRRFFQDLNSYDLLVCAAQIRPRPLLIIHGTADEVVPIGDGQLLFDAAEGTKKYVKIEGADHRFSEHQTEIRKHFFNWLVELRNHIAERYT